MIFLPRRIPKRLFQLLLIVGCLYIMSGGFYNQIIKPTQYVYVRGNWYTIHPDFSDQTTRESFLAFMCNISTLVGLWVISLIGNNRTRLTSDRMMLLGILFISIGLCGSYYLLEMKRTAVPIG